MIQYLPGNDYPLHFRSSFIECCSDDIPKETFHWIIPDIPVTAQHLNGAKGRISRCLCGKELCHGGLFRKGDFVLLQVGCTKNEELSRSQFSIGIGNHPLNRLETGKGFTKGFSPFDIFCCEGNGLKSHTDCKRSNADPPSIQFHHSDFETFPFLAQEPVA